MGESEPATGDELQFDHAEYEAPGPSVPTCAACKQAISAAYFEVNGIILCPRCRGRIEASLTGGSGAARFLRAAVFGTGAGAAGFALYFGVMKLAHMEIGLISILVGFMVGGAVRKGARGRGGWLYQALAIFLTYSAVAASYSAVVVPRFLSELQSKRAQGHEAAAAEKPGAGAFDAVRPGDGPLNLGQAVLALAVVAAVVLAFCYAVPILIGIQSPISLLIVGFALWEAWKLNRRIPLRFTGPYRVGDGPVEVVAHA
jgi:hypothetical protein